MKAHWKIYFAGVVALVAVLGAVGFAALPRANAEDMGGVTKAICVLQGTEGNDDIRGTVTFTQQADGVLIEAHVMGLPASSKHGFHIHEFGDISKSDGTATGGHYNPMGHDHGAPSDTDRHEGDLGNIEVNSGGHAMYSRVDKVIQLNGPMSILGRGIIIHAGTDDLKTQPTGDAGARMAQGVIGIAKP